MADLFKAGAALGDILFGKEDPRAYADQLGRNASAQESMEKARRERLRRIAQEGLQSAIKADPVLGARSDLAYSILGQAEGQPNLSTYTGGLGDLGDLAIDTQREEALKAGDLRRVNQLTALKADKNYEPVVVEDGLLRPSGVDLADEAFTMVPTPTALSTIEKNEQLGQAAITRANRPPAPRTPRPSASADEAEIVRQARERISGGADPKKVADYLRAKGYPSAAKKIYSGK